MVQWVRDLWVSLHRYTNPIHEDLLCDLVTSQMSHFQSHHTVDKISAHEFEGVGGNLSLLYSGPNHEKNLTNLT